MKHRTLVVLLLYKSRNCTRYFHISYRMKSFSYLHSSKDSSKIARPHHGTWEHATFLYHLRITIVVSYRSHTGKWETIILLIIYIFRYFCLWRIINVLFFLSHKFFFLFFFFFSPLPMFDSPLYLPLPLLVVVNICAFVNVISRLGQVEEVGMRCEGEQSMCLCLCDRNVYISYW